MRKIIYMVTLLSDETIKGNKKGLNSQVIMLDL